MEQFLLQYVTNNVENFRTECGDRSFSFATDKGNVNGQSLQVSMVALPTNLAFVATLVATI